jgi:hypothetical protein
VHVDLSDEDRSLALDFSLAEALRPALGPGFALPETDRPRRLVTAAATLGLDRLLAASFVRDGDVTFLVGTLYDVRRGMIQREGRVRLGAGRSVPPGGLSALAGFLLAGQSSTLVAPGVRDQPAVPPVPSARLAPPALKPAQPPERPAVAGTLVPEPTPEVRQGAPRSKLLGWSAVGCGALAVGLGVFATAKGIDASKQFGSARSLRAGGNVPAFSDIAVYNQRVADGNSAASAATVTGIGAGVALVGAGVFGYLSYKQTGEIGPIRF